MFQLYSATWLWLPLLVLFLVQALRCNTIAKFSLYKLLVYFAMLAIGLQCLWPHAHLALRTLFFDIGARGFLLLGAVEMFWSAYRHRPASTGHTPAQQRTLFEDEEDEDRPQQKLPPARWGFPRWKELIEYAVYVLIALVYLGWLLLGMAFAFTFSPGL